MSQQYINALGVIKNDNHIFIIMKRVAQVHVRKKTALQIARATPQTPTQQKK